MRWNVTSKPTVEVQCMAESNKDSLPAIPEPFWVCTHYHQKDLNTARNEKIESGEYVLLDQHDCNNAPGPTAACVITTAPCQYAELEVKAEPS